MNLFLWLQYFYWDGEGRAFPGTVNETFLKYNKLWKQCVLLNIKNPSFAEFYFSGAADDPVYITVSATDIDFDVSETKNMKGWKFFEQMY